MKNIRIEVTNEDVRVINCAIGLHIVADDDVLMVFFQGEETGWAGTWDDFVRALEKDTDHIRDLSVAE